jgi:serine/threonine protein kinase
MHGIKHIVVLFSCSLVWGTAHNGGTLEDCLQLLRSYGSEVRKTHLSLDIALGINAIHACGLVHGDIKPSNIIIQEHPTRTVIAKISDFNGVDLASSYG